MWEVAVVQCANSCLSFSAKGPLWADFYSFPSKDPMQKAYKVETSISHDLAELYSILVDEFEANSSIPLSDLNRTLLQTGIIHHLTMMHGLGLVSGEKEKDARIDALVENVASDTLLWDVLDMVRSYWRDRGVDGQGGAIDLKA